jgi:hypothetical protein
MVTVAAIPPSYVKLREMIEQDERDRKPATTDATEIEPEAHNGQESDQHPANPASD